MVMESLERGVKLQQLDAHLDEVVRIHKDIEQLIQADRSIGAAVKKTFHVIGRRLAVIREKLTAAHKLSVYGVDDLSSVDADIYGVKLEVQTLVNQILNKEDSVDRWIDETTGLLQDNESLTAKVSRPRRHKACRTRTCVIAAVAVAVLTALLTVTVVMVARK